MRRYGGLLLLLAACTEPSYTSGHLRCATSGRACPESFFCAEGRCFGDGTDLAGAPVLDLGGSDLSTVDLAAPPAPDMSMAPTCGKLAVKICDSFETLNPRWSENVTTGTSIGIDAARSHRGGASLHVHSVASTATEAGGSLLTSDSLPLTGTLYTRVWLYLGAGFPAPYFNQVINYTGGSGGGISYGMVSGHPVDNDYTVPKSYAESSTAMIPTGRWVCLTMQIDQSASTGAVELFVDGAQVSDVSLTGAQTPALSQLYLGIDWLSNSAVTFPDSDLWLDDLIVDDKPVTCAE